MPDADTHTADTQAADCAIAAQCLAGQQSAMRRLVEQHQAMVLRLCERMLGNRHDAEDVLQETFVRAIRSLSRWDQTRAFKPWLLAIAANRCRTALGKRRSIASDAQAMADEIPARSDGQQSLGYLTEEVTLALGELRNDVRQAFELFHYEQLAYAEIAEVLEVPVGTVKTWIHRARQEVAAQLVRRGVVEKVNSHCGEPNHKQPVHEKLAHERPAPRQPAELELPVSSRRPSVLVVATDG